MGDIRSFCICRCDISRPVRQVNVCFVQVKYNLHTSVSSMDMCREMIIRENLKTNAFEGY